MKKQVDYLMISGDVANAVWRSGDYYADDNGEFLQVPDSWDMEDLRQGEVIYRPYTPKNLRLI